MHSLVSESSPRLVCARCRRPQVVCYCAQLRPFVTRTRVVFLQHPRERRTPIGTARMAHLALPNSELHVGVHFDPKLAEGDDVALLYPGPTSVDARTVKRSPSRLLVVDGTWSQARKVVSVNPFLRALPQLSLAPSAPGNYRIRKEPAPHCLSTIEAVSEILGVLEGEPQRFREMLEAFTFMVDRQLDHVQSRSGPSRYKTHGSAPRLGHRWPHLLKPIYEKLVLVCLEVNQRTVAEAEGLRPELVHWVACRPAAEEGAERFEAVIRPERPLGAETPYHLGLEADAISAGESLPEVLERFSEFLELGPDDAAVAGWGHFTQDLLTSLGFEGVLDLRPALIRARRARFNGVEAALEWADPEARPVPWAPGRAGMRLAALTALVQSGITGCPR